MALIAKLVNPTPFDVEIPYEKGISIKIPADGDLDLTMGQLDDFRPGKPGSEETRKILTFEGVFLQDSDLSFDLQALNTLKACVRDRQDRINTFTDRTKNSRLAGGASVDDESMAELLVSSGYARMQEGTDKIKTRIKILQGVVDADKSKGSVRQNLDPERTCFVINPPRQFPSKTSLAMFLSENPAIKVKHDAFLDTAVDPTVPAAEINTPSLSATANRSFEEEGEFNG